MQMVHDNFQIQVQHVHFLSGFFYVGKHIYL